MTGVQNVCSSDLDFHSDMVVGRNGETIGEICNKFFVGREGVKTEGDQYGGILGYVYP